MPRSPPCFELAVGLHGDAAPEAVGHQHLLCLCDAQLPREPGMFDGSLGRIAGAAVMSTYQNHVGVPFGHSSSDRTHTNLGYQLHMDSSLGVDILKIMY